MSRLPDPTPGTTGSAGNCLVAFPRKAGDKNLLELGSGRRGPDAAAAPSASLTLQEYMRAIGSVSGSLCFGKPLPAES